MSNLRNISGILHRIKYHHIIAGIATLFFVYQIWLMWPHTVDDAYISLRYAQNWIDGYGITWNYIGPRVEGYSNFLWVIIMGSYLSLGLEGILPAKVIGSVVAIAQLPVIYGIGRNIGLSKNWSSLSVLIYSFIPAITFWAVSGMATSLFTLFFIIAIYFLLKSSKKSNKIIASLFFGLTALTRHEGMILFLAVTTTFFLIRVRSDHFKKSIIDSIYVLLPGGLLYTVYFLWRYSYYGHFFPNTVYIKSASSDGILSIVLSTGHPLQLVSYLAPLLLLVLIGLSTTSERKYSKKLWISSIIASILVGVIGIIAGIIFTPEFVTYRFSPDGSIASSTARSITILRGVSILTGAIFLAIGIVFQQKPKLVKYLYFIPKNDTGSQNYFLLTSPVIALLIVSYFITPSMMHGIRFFHPVVPLIAVLSAVGIKNVYQKLEGIEMGVNSRTITSIVLILLLINPFGIGAIPIIQSDSNTELRGDNFNSPIYSVNNFHMFSDNYGQSMQEGPVPIGKWLGEHTIRADYIAVGDAGAMPYYCRCNTEDILELNSYQATHGDRSAQWLLQKDPQFIVLTANNISSYDRSTSGFWGEIYSNEQFQAEYELVYVINHNEDSYRGTYVYWIFTHEDNDINELRSSLESSTTSPLILPDNSTHN